jgi:hypothetical protein
MLTRASSISNTAEDVIPHSGNAALSPSNQMLPLQTMHAAPHSVGNRYRWCLALPLVLRLLSRAGARNLILLCFCRMHCTAAGGCFSDGMTEPRLRLVPLRCRYRNQKRTGVCCRPKLDRSCVASNAGSVGPTARTFPCRQLLPLLMKHTIVGGRLRTCSDK